MRDIDFSKIAPRGGSLTTAFEDLCCQVAARTRPIGTKFERYRGDGGDGGVECKVIDPIGSETGWQTKYIFDIEGLLKQAHQSLATALTVHANLTRYVICFPFDLTGKTGRKGKSQTQRFDEWARKAEIDARANGRVLTIERRSAHDIRDLILESDSSGGLRHYFFSATTFSDKWFTDHVASAKVAAGPRYNREISLETPLSKWFTSFGEATDWQKQFNELLDACRKKTSQIEELIEEKRSDPMLPAWPDALYDKGKKAVADSRICIQRGAALTIAPMEARLSEVQQLFTRLIDDLTAIGRELSTDLDAKHGEGSANSRPFRSFMAEYQVEFPAANLDAISDALEKWRQFSHWLSSASDFLAFRPVFVLSGSAGTGKTHSLCDIAQQRLADGAYTCILFGHQFDGDPDPWTRFAESLGIPLTLGRDGILDALNASAECSGKKLLICVDAVNETKPRRYWFGRFLEFAAAVASRARLKLCVTCRTSFLAVCLPNDVADEAVEHQGFAGMERQACNAFFSYYNLEPPLVPVLQPELANPLYLSSCVKR